MAKTTKQNPSGSVNPSGDLDGLLHVLYVAIGNYLGVDGSISDELAADAEEAAAKPAAKKATKAAAKKAAAPAKTEAARRKQLAKMDDDELRDIVIGYDYEEEDVADADTDDLIAAIIDEEFPSDEEAESEDEAEEEEEADEEEADEEEEDEEAEADESYSRDELEGMNLRELKALAKEAGYVPADLKGMDQDAIVDLLLGDSEDEDEEESDEESDDEFYSEDELNAMDLDELKELAEEYEVEVEGRVSKKKLIAALLEE